MTSEKKLGDYYDKWKIINHLTAIWMYMIMYPVKIKIWQAQTIYMYTFDANFSPCRENALCRWLQFFQRSWQIQHWILSLHSIRRCECSQTAAGSQPRCPTLSRSPEPISLYDPCHCLSEGRVKERSDTNKTSLQHLYEQCCTLMQEQS